MVVYYLKQLSKKGNFCLSLYTFASPHFLNYLEKGMPFDGEHKIIRTLALFFIITIPPPIRSINYPFHCIASIPPHFILYIFLYSIGYNIEEMQFCMFVKEKVTPFKGFLMEHSNPVVTLPAQGQGNKFSIPLLLDTRLKLKIRAKFRWRVWVES